MDRKGDEIIFQQFILVSEELLEEEDANPKPLSPYERWKKIRRALEIHGLGLMCAQSTIAGVPTEVIVGIPADCISYLPMKDCFYELATKFNLPFRSGEWYVGDFSPRMSGSVFSDENYRAFVKLKTDEQWFDEHHGKWVGFVGGKLVAEAENEDAILNQLETKYSGQDGFYFQVLTEEEEGEKAIQIP